MEEGECEILHLRRDRQMSDMLVMHKSKHVLLTWRPLLVRCACVQVVDGEHVLNEDYLWA